MPKNKLKNALVKLVLIQYVVFKNGIFDIDQTVLLFINQFL